MYKITNVSVTERRMYGAYTAKEWHRYHVQTRVYVWPERETVMENLVNRRSRPYNEWRPLVLKELRDAGYQVEKLQWNQKAGCTMCPCSPGFIVHLKNSERAICNEDRTPIDIHLTVRSV